MPGCCSIFHDASHSLFGIALRLLYHGFRYCGVINRVTNGVTIFVNISVIYQTVAWVSLAQILCGSCDGLGKAKQLYIYGAISYSIMER